MLRTPDLDLPLDHPDRALLAELAERLGVPAPRVVLAESMPAYIRHALEQTPQVRDEPRQQALTERFLTPVLAGLESLLLALRAELDPGLRRQQPSRGGKAYPAGQCLEITIAVLQRLERLEAATLAGPAAQAFAAWRAFLDAGGAVRRAWGDLRGEFFQNALIVGTLYVDVANDTVVTTKPPVQILPFARAQFSPIADYAHFAAIAKRYWAYRLLPNHLFPKLAPYLPLIEICPNGGIRLGPSASYMFGLTLANQFRPSELALAAAPMPSQAFDQLRAALGPDAPATPPDANAGRAAALRRCQDMRLDARFQCAASFNQAMLDAGEVNRRLARLRVSS
jgi:hypothetical protein